MGKSAYFDVRTYGLALPQEVTGRPFTAGKRIQSQASPFQFCCLKIVTGTGFLILFGFSHAIITPPMLHTHFQLHVARTRRRKGQRLRTFEERNAL
jgi:hypothetical protein